MQVMRLYGKLK